MSRVLIVDDHPENLYVLRVLMTGHGWEVEEARNGVEALEQVRQHSPELIVSDLLMPVMDGYTLLRHWKADEKLKSIPFVVYTATYTDTNDEKLAMDLGADAFIIKPAEPEAFIDRINEVIDSTKKALPHSVRMPVGDESSHVKQYNASLIRKLEQKMLQLEQANRALELDIAQRKKLEAERTQLQSQLIQAQKMESIGRLVGGIAHDFNNLIAVILGYTDSALSSLDAAAPAYIELREIKKAAQRSAAITNQLLSFARMHPVAPQVIRLNECVGDMVAMLKQLIGKQIELIWVPGNDVDTVLIDPAHITQILTNLCVNARDAIICAGKITITTSQVVSDETRHSRYGDLLPGTYTKLAVSDTGCGMDEYTLSHLFEPFFTTKAVGKGTGLGLATIYGSIKQYEGFINVNSAVGKGTTFEVFLPAVK